MNLLDDVKQMYWLRADKNEKDLEPYQINADEIIQQMPKKYRIDHLEFAHPMDQMTDMRDWGRVDDMDEFITAFGNEKIALALYHYSFLGYVFDDGDSRIPSRERTQIIGLAGLYFRFGAKLNSDDFSMINNMLAVLRQYVDVPFTIKWKHDFGEYISCDQFLKERCEDGHT